MHEEGFVRIIAKRTLRTIWTRHSKARGLGKPGTKRGDELDVLTTLVGAYEAKHHAFCPPDPIDAIKFRMDQLGMTRKDLEAMLGGLGRVSEILTKKRSLSLEMISRLHRKLHIPLENLVGMAA